MNAVIYSSKGGNTKKIAEAIAKGAGVKAQSINDVAELPQIDILFTGASIYAGGISGVLRKFLKNLDRKQAAKVVVFGSSVSGKSALAEIKSILEPKDIPVSEEAFQCKGSFLGFCRGHPDADDLARAEDFAKRICAEKI